MSVWGFSARQAAAEGEQYELEEVVVTAARIEVPSRAVPGSIDVLHDEDLQAMGLPVTKVDEVLQYLSGVTAVRSQGIYSLIGQATLRGLTNEQSRTLVLVDGVPINKSDTGEVNFNRLNLFDVERIEVFKGPYIIPVREQRHGRGDKRCHQEAETRSPRLGRCLLRNVQHLRGELGGSLAKREQKAEGLFLRASGHYLQSEGYVSVPPERKTPYTVERFVHELSGLLLVGYDFGGGHEATLRVEYYDDKRGEGEKIRVEDGVCRDFDTQFYVLSYRGRHEGWKWQISAFRQFENYKRVVERMRGTSYTHYDVDSERKDTGLSVIVSRALSKNHVLTGGFDYRLGSVDALYLYRTSTDRAENRGKLDNLGVWAQYEGRFLEGNLSLWASLRFDYARFHDGYFYSTIKPFNRLSGFLNSRSWIHLSPRLGVKYWFSKDLAAYASYGRGFRAAILDDLCRSGILWGIYKIANPELKPEKLDSVEAGLEVNPTDRLEMRLAAYYSLGRDFLYFVPTGLTLDGRPLYQRENVAKVKSLGTEFDLTYKLDKDTRLFFNYTFARAYISEFPENEALEGIDLVRTPRHQVKAGLVHDFPWFSCAIYWLYKGPQKVYTNEPKGEIADLDGYSMVNLRLWRNLYKGLRVQLGVDNLFNQRYTGKRRGEEPRQVYNPAAYVRVLMT